LIGNGLLTSGAQAILSGINTNLKELNMSDNPLNGRKAKMTKEA